MEKIRCTQDFKIVEVEKIDDDTYAVTVFGIRILITKEMFEREFDPIY